MQERALQDRWVRFASLELLRRKHTLEWGSRADVNFHDRRSAVSQNNTVDGI